MRLVMKLGELFGRDVDAFCKRGHRVQLDASEDWLALLAFLEKAHCIVGIGIEGELLQGTKSEEGQHVATRERGDVGLLGIGELGLAEILRSGGAGHGLAVAEIDLMFARVFLVTEGRIVAGPSESGGVLGHAESV